MFTLSYSRALFLEFCFDQQMENFLRAHIHAFEDIGCPRTILYDNTKSVLLERRGEAVHFHPRLLELAAHYHFAPRPCHPYRASEKGRVERAISYVRHSFFAARPFSTLSDFNRQALLWRDQVAHRRPWPGGDGRTVEEVWEEEKAFLLPLPAHRLETDLVLPVRSRKTICIRFDLNDYSIPPSAVGRPLTLVAFLLGRRQRAQGRKAPLPIELRQRPELEDLYVQSHNPETYDELASDDDES